MSPAIEVTDLRFRYPPLRDEAPFTLSVAAWTVPTGASVAVHGPSGCGKSTLLNLIAGVVVPDAGRLVVAGAALAAMSATARRAWRVATVGFIFQDFPLVDYLSAVENVLLPYRISALRLDHSVRTRALALLEELGLGEKARRRPAQLSQGERQRVAIARALVTEPALLLADEPTAGLDPQQSQQVAELLEGLCAERGLTLVLVTHDPAMLARFAMRLEVG